MKHLMETTQPTQARENLMTSMANCTHRTHPGPTTTVATSMTKLQDSSHQLHAKTGHENGNTRTQKPQIAL